MLRAVGMIEAGSRQRTVALALNTSQSVISRLWTRYRSTGTVAERHGGRYRCTTRRQDRYIQILTRRAPTITAMMLAVRLHHSSGNLISDQTVRNRLHEVNLHSRRPLRVPPIAMHNRRIRYQWALEHRNWAEEQWRFVCFSDESRFGMRPDTRRIRHWRTPGRQQRLKSCQEVHPYSGETIMVWAGIWIGGRTELIWIRGNLNAQIYAETIVSDVIVPLQVQIGPLFQLMHDNARPHTARVVRQTLAAANINVLPWPAQSPDLNPIEHAWDMLQRRALPNMEGIQSQEDLFLLLQRTWAAIPQRDLDELILKTPTSGSETAAAPPPRKSVERTHKLTTPEKSPAKLMETGPGLSFSGGLKKPTLLLPPSLGAAPPKSFGSDASLPTLSASLGRPSLESSPKKKGRGRPRKNDKDKSTSSPDLFSPLALSEKLSLPSLDSSPKKKSRGRPKKGDKDKSTSSPDSFRVMQGAGGEAKLSTPVPASFLQYRGPPGEVGSDSDLALSRSSSSSSVWSQSCSSCTHYDDNGSDHSCSLSTSDASSNGPLDGDGPDRRQRRAPLTDASDTEPTTPVKGRGTRSSSSKTPVKSAVSDVHVQLEPLQLVWAKCRGYPWYPALIIDPKIPKGFVYNGVPLPVPPQDVLNLKKNHSHEPILYLVLFFDVKRTWQWLPPNKLEVLGVDKSVDQAKLVESRKPTERKAVKKAYNDAMQFRKQVDGEDK
ncbi:hypothetical protein evm_005090 [Chilo suppressalis]|nr:hypothetical protein evm_005090 [Chilo suppressalis]